MKESSDSLPCAYLGTCGGCQAQPNQSFDEFQQYKITHLQPLFEEFGEPLEIWQPANKTHYRVKVEWRVRWEDNGVRFGYFKKTSHSSREFLAVEHCTVASTVHNQLLDSLDLFERNAPSLLKARLVAQCVEDSDALALELICPKETEEQWSTFAQWLIDKPYVRSCQIRGSYEKAVVHKVHRTRPSPLTTASLFRQANDEANRYLKSVLKTWIRSSGHQNVLELFCGNGNLSFDLEHKVNGYESHPTAVELAQRVGGTRHEYKVFDCHKAVPPFPEESGILVLDPPRVGLLDQVLSIAQFPGSHMIYISCEPSKFLEEWPIFRDQGWRLLEWRSVDMLPWTVRWETMFFLTRKKG